MLFGIASETQSTEGPYNQQSNGMNKEPCGKTLEHENVNEDDNPRHEERSKKFKEGGNRVVGQLAEEPPKEKGEPRKEQTDEREPKSKVVHKWVFYREKKYIKVSEKVDLF